MPGTKTCENSPVELTFLGATQTVTGSKYLLEQEGYRCLIDCGLFQGRKDLRLRNREPFPVEPASIRSVVLTHAHLDHSGFLPVLLKAGLDGPVYATPATIALCQILLPDSGRIQEEEAEYANRKGFSKHRPALPLYTEQDAEWSLRRFQSVGWGSAYNLSPELKFSFEPAGHILGAAMATFESRGKKILFSGDLGRAEDPVFHPPRAGHDVDYVVLESTYGARVHPKVDLLEQLALVIRRTVDRKGVVVVPAFSVGRAQTLLHCLHQLKIQRRIPNIPIYLNSPMSAKATRILSDFSSETRLTRAALDGIGSVAVVVANENESKALNERTEPMVILSASGMATGGRVLHHIRAFGPDERNTILFTGFQAEGTRGALLLAGAKETRIHGQMIPIRAEIAEIDSLSAHADAGEILFWLSQFKRPPKTIFITHGEPSAAEALKGQIESKLGVTCVVPAYLQRVTL